MTRAWNIALRTGHIATMAILLGGHAFEVAPERLRVSLWLTIGTGAVLVAIESGGRALWIHQGRGLVTIAKLILLCGVLFVWEHRLPILLCVVVLASVGSHMPSRYRYYSVLYRRVIHDGSGPGGKGTEGKGTQAGGSLA